MSLMRLQRGVGLQWMEGCRTAASKTTEDAGMENGISAFTQNTGLWQIPLKVWAINVKITKNLLIAL